MRTLTGTRRCAPVALALGVLAISANFATADLILGPEEFVKAGGTDIAVPGYSVPSFAHWNDDGLMDLIVGEGGGGELAKVRVYLNVGSASAPQFNTWFYAQSYGTDLTFTGPSCPPCYQGVCMGLFPRVAYWGADGLKDLLVGQPDGSIKIFTNLGSEAAPTFDMGTVIQVGPPGAKLDLMLGGRATPSCPDWNSDGRKDLVVGALDGKVHVFLNEGTDADPDFRIDTPAQAGASALRVPSERSSPHVFDADGDGRKDLLLGNTNGQLLLYLNVGTDQAPSFAGYTEVQAAGVPIDLPGTPRSRPFVCDWTGDGLPDVLVGSGDGKVRLYQGIPEPSCAMLLVLGLAAAGCRRRRS
jgi:hypothetical protein